MEIRDYRPLEDAAAFRSLNVAWISKYFQMEAPDYEALDHPEEHILEPGGRIFMAFDGDRAIGCCALIFVRPGVFEVAKMAVDEGHQGQGIGRRILEHTIAEAALAGGTLLVLETNHRLENAVHLYESVGFRHLAPEVVKPSPYSRADVHMELRLS